jgi:hypothetical protein
MWILTCPECSHEAPAKDFGWGLTAECSCPQCDLFFQWDPDDEEE